MNFVDTLKFFNPGFHNLTSYSFRGFGSFYTVKKRGGVDPLLRRWPKNNNKFNESNLKIEEKYIVKPLHLKILY